MPNDNKTAKPVAEDVSKIEKKFKLSLHNIEKRFVDLEVAISELVERVNSLTTSVENKEVLDDIKQRMSEIEDMIMVEQAGVVELKNIMGKIDDRIDTHPLEDKIREVEGLAQSAIEKLEKPPEVPIEVSEHISRLEKEMSALKVKTELDINPLEFGEMRKNLKSLDGKIEATKLVFDALKRGVDERLKTVTNNTSVSAVDMDLLVSKVSSLKASVDIMSDKKGEADLKFAELHSKIELLKKDLESSPPKRMLAEMKKHKHDIERSKVQLESLERVIKHLATDINEVEKTAEKFKSIDKLTNLKKEIDEKIRNFKMVEGGVQKLSDRVELIYNDLDKRIMSMNKTERDMKAAESMITELGKDMEDVKIELKRRLEKGSIAQIMDVAKKDMHESVDKAVNMYSRKNKADIERDVESKIDQSIQQMGSTIKKNIHAMADAEARIEDHVNKSISTMNKSVERKVQDMGIKVSEALDATVDKKLDDKFNKKFDKNFDQRLDKVLKEVQQTKKVTAQVADIYKKYTEMPKDVKVLKEEMKFISSKMTELGNMYSKIKGVPGTMERMRHEMDGMKAVAKKFATSAEVYTDVKDMPEEVKAMREQMKAMRGVISKVAHFANQEGSLPKEMKLFMKDVALRMSELENSLKKVRSSVDSLSTQVVQERMPDQDAYLKEMTDKLVFIETRLAAMETIFHKPQPIILE